MMTDLGRWPGGRPWAAVRCRWMTWRWSEALRSGDPQAPRLLIERYQGVVFGLCFRMLNHQQDAEDVVQETFIRALRAMAGFDSGSADLALGSSRSPPTDAALHWPARP